MPTRAESFERLPDRLRRIVPLIAEGKSNHQIVGELYLAVHTVEAYVSEILDRTDGFTC
jgi:DNA-binding NarL/FixJ family response regulator